MESEKTKGATTMDTRLYVLLVVLVTMGCGQNADKKNFQRALNQQEKALLHRLEGDTSFKTFTFVNWQALKGGEKEAVDVNAANNQLRLSLHRAIVSGKGSAKARKVEGTKEGDPIEYYLTVDSGKIELIVDVSRDRFGTGTVARIDIDKSEIGFFDDQQNFVSVQEDPLTKQVLFLKLSSSKRPDAYVLF